MGGEKDITSMALLPFSAESEIRRLQLQESLDQRTIQALQAENQRLRQELAESIQSYYYEAEEVVHGRIGADPEVLGGKPYFRGTRIPVYIIIEHAAEGYSAKRIQKEFPGLTEDDIRDALLFTSVVTKAPWKKGTGS